jgi:hypothetical protein
MVWRTMRIEPHRFDDAIIHEEDLPLDAPKRERVLRQLVNQRLAQRNHSRQQCA